MKNIYKIDEEELFNSIWNSEQQQSIQKKMKTRLWKSGFCRICGKKFTRMHDARRHEKNIHKQTSEQLIVSTSITDTDMEM